MAVIIFKAVERCNSNCLYCDVIKKRQNATMSFDLLETVFLRIDEYLRDRPNEKVYFTWHGGEVGLLGGEYFRRAGSIQDKCCPTTKTRIEHIVQSNMTLMTQELLDAFRALGITQVGSSFEPLPHVRGFGPERDSAAYNRLFLRGAALCERNGFIWGVIYVVHRGSLAKPLDIFNLLVNLNPCCNPTFNPVNVYGNDVHGLSITPEEFADFLGAIFPTWWAHRERYPKVKPFNGYVRSYLQREPSLVCETSGRCAHEWVYIGPEGHTSQCGRSGDFDILSYGNIQDKGLGEILADPQREQFVARRDRLADTACSGCRFWGLCHGGCPLDSYHVHGDFSHRSDMCVALRRFLEQYFEPVTGLHRDFRRPDASAAS